MRKSHFRLIILAVMLMFTPLKSYAVEDQDYDVDCSNPQGQAGINICLAREAGSVEEELGTICKDMETNYDDARKHLFRNANRTFAIYVQSQCEYEADLIRSGKLYPSMTSQLRSECRIRLNRQRIDLLSNNDNEDEDGNDEE